MTCTPKPEGPFFDAGAPPADGFTYLYFNASDMAMFCGHAHPAIAAAVPAQVARSTQFLLPTQASVEVAEELARRYPVGQWQFTLSATQANTEVIRLARAVTGREVIVLFQGHYHGHFEEGLVDLEDGQASPVQRGCPRESPAGSGSPSSTTRTACGPRSKPATSHWF
jgi:glutamate-1-semialdehyde 2,1-aminomutase